MAMLQIPITKGKSTVEIDSDKLPEDVYREALIQGLKVLANREQSKITKETYPDADELKAAAMSKATEMVEKIMTSKIKFSGGAKVAKASGAVMTEAMRLARNLVKDEIKRQRLKISHFEASEITKAAKELLTDDPSLIETAKANLEARQAVPVKINVSAIPVSEKKVKAAEAKKLAAKSTLSKTQAGKTAVRAKAQPQAETVN